MIRNESGAPNLRTACVGQVCRSSNGMPIGLNFDGGEGFEEELPVDIGSLLRHDCVSRMELMVLSTYGREVWSVKVGMIWC